MTEISVSNKIVLKTDDKRLVNEIVKDLTFVNPEYATKVRMGINLYGTKKTFDICNIDETSSNFVVTIPYGYLYTLKQKYEFEHFEANFNNNGFREYKSKIQLRDYQEVVLKDVIKRDSGVILMPAGSGKTITALELTARLNKTCLWITHTQDLLTQSYDRAKSNFDLSKDAFGKITAGKINLGTHITFATVQTLSKINLDEIKSCFDIVVVDECHRVVPNTSKVVEKIGMFQKVIESIPAKYKYGLTATPHRSDGLFECVYKIIGEKIAEVSKEEVKDNIVPVKIRLINTAYTIFGKKELLDSAGVPIHSRIVNDVAKDNERNTVIVKVLLRNQENFNLILSERLNHLDLLSEMLKSEVDSDKIRVIDGKTKAKDREESLRLMREQKINYLFATYKLAKEGLDIPCLNRLFLAQSVKDYSIVEQSIGRVARSFEGKKLGGVYDFVDGNVGIFKRHGKERKKIYEKEGYQVVI